MGNERDRKDEAEHLGGPTPGVDRGAGMTSSRGETDGPTSTGATTTGQGSTGTGNPPDTVAEDKAPASGQPVHGTDTSQESPGSVGDAPGHQGDPEVSDEEAAQPAQRIEPGEA